MATQNAYPKALTGLCVGVLSGDRVVFHGPIAKDTGLPVQKVLHLSSISTPKVDLAGGNDEPFGYASRQFVRTRIIGKQMQFTIETKVGQIELGHITYEGQDLSTALLREGLAKIRGDRAKGKNAEEYTAAQDKARKELKNLWSQKPQKEHLYHRKIVHRDFKHLCQELQAKPGSTAIVEQVHPSTFTLYFPQLHAIAQMSSPELQVVVLSEKKENGETKNNAREIRICLEAKTLNREAHIVVRGHTAEGLSGYIKNENFESRKYLLTHGYAKLSKQALNILDVNQFKELKAIAQEAATHGRGLWKQHKESTTKTQSLQQTFVGRVIEVLSGDSLKVQNLEQNETVRIYLSNVKAPALGKPFAFEAKEALRKRTIGRKVKVDIEFSKNIPVKKDDKTEEKNFVFATIFENGKNIGATLLEEGLVTIQVPRAEDEFTKYFDELKVADEEAKKKKKGLNGEPVRVPVFNDITSGKEGKYKVDIAKSKTIFSFLKDQKRLTGVVEFVLNGSRLKIRMHQQSCYIILVIEGIRCLPNQGEYKRWSQQALEFSKQNIQQRDVQIELSKIDKKGIFHGTVYIEKKNYALDLLERGLAINFGKTNPKYEQFESIAKKNKVGLWSQPINLSAFKGEEDKEYTPVNFTKNLRMLEVISPTEFYFDTPNAKKPEIPQKPEPAKEIRQGEIYSVKFTQDGVYYRARIRRVFKNGTYHVAYIDYGNQETVPAANICILEKPLKQIKSSLYRCGLYGLENVSSAAVPFLQELLDADFKVEFKEQSADDYLVIIHDKDGTINEQALAEGYGECSAQNPEWIEAAKNAKANRRGIWQGSDD